MTSRVWAQTEDCDPVSALNKQKADQAERQELLWDHGTYQVHVTLRAIAKEDILEQFPPRSLDQTCDT